MVDQQQLQALITEPAGLRNVTTLEINEWIENYPYISTLHLLKKLKLNQEKLLNDNELQKDIIYIHDREQLYDLIHGNYEPPKSTTKKEEPVKEKVELTEMPEIVIPEPLSKKETAKPKETEEKPKEKTEEKATETIKTTLSNKDVSEPETTTPKKSIADELKEAVEALKTTIKDDGIKKDATIVEENETDQSAVEEKIPEGETTPDTKEEEIADVIAADEDKDQEDVEEATSEIVEVTAEDETTTEEIKEEEAITLDFEPDESSFDRELERNISEVSFEFDFAGEEVTAEDETIAGFIAQKKGEAESVVGVETEEINDFFSWLGHTKSIDPKKELTGETIVQPANQNDEDAIPNAETAENPETQAVTSEEESALDFGDAVNSFISKQIRKKEKPKSNKKAEIEERTQKSLEIDDSMLTETYVKILTLQGKHQKAIEALERMSLIYPEKSNSFVSQIEELKNKLK